MRTDYIAVIALGLSITVPTCRGEDSFAMSRFEKHRFDQSWSTAAGLPMTPRQVCSAVKQRVKYRRDMTAEDEWRDGRDTWNRRSGDCEDMAACVRDLCKHKGMSAEIYVFRSQTAGKGHAVAIGGSPGELWMSSNGSYQRIRSLADARTEVARAMGWWPESMTPHSARERQPRSTNARGLRVSGGHVYLIAGNTETMLTEPAMFVDPEPFLPPEAAIGAELFIGAESFVEPERFSDDGSPFGNPEHS